MSDYKHGRYGSFHLFDGMHVIGCTQYKYSTVHPHTRPGRLIDVGVSISICWVELTWFDLIWYPLLDFLRLGVCGLINCAVGDQGYLTETRLFCCCWSTSILVSDVYLRWEIATLLSTSIYDMPSIWLAQFSMPLNGRYWLYWSFLFKFNDLTAQLIANVINNLISDFDQQ